MRPALSSTVALQRRLPSTGAEHRKGGYLLLLILYGIFYVKQFDEKSSKKRAIGEP